MVLKKKKKGGKNQEIWTLAQQKAPPNPHVTYHGICCWLPFCLLTFLTVIAACRFWFSEISKPGKGNMANDSENCLLLGLSGIFLHAPFITQLTLEEQSTTWCGCPHGETFEQKTDLILKWSLLITSTGRLGGGDSGRSCMESNLPASK